jgi:hypothetical protein
MKKLVRIMGLCALVSLAFVSCKKAETKTFSITSARVTSDSKTHIVPAASVGGVKQLVWDEGDEIKVFNQAGDYRAFTVSSDYNGETVATFNLVGDQLSFMDQLGENGGNNYSAFYPYAVGEGSNVRVPVLARQTFDGLDFLPNTFPMYGSDNADGDFEFNTNAGLLVIEFERGALATDAECSLDSLELLAVNPEKHLAGNYVYSNDGTSNENPAFEGTGNSIMLVPESAITIPGEYPGIVFSWLFVVPEIDLQDGFVVRGYYGGEQKFSLGARATITKGTLTYMNSRVTLPVN